MILPKKLKEEVEKYLKATLPQMPKLHIEFILALCDKCYIEGKSEALTDIRTNLVKLNNSILNP